jgi:hypothetical protein
MTNAFESVQVNWSASDEQFFRVAAELFPAPYLQGATALLASYDDEVASPTATFAAPRSAPSSRTAEPAAAPSTA